MESDPSSKVDTPVKAVLLDHLRVAWVVPGEALVAGRVPGGPAYLICPRRPSVVSCSPTRACKVCGHL